MEPCHHRGAIGTSLHSYLTILRLGLLVGFQRETLARFETLETLAAMGAARLFPVSPTGDRALFPCPDRFPFAETMPVECNPNSNPCPCCSSSSRGCSASDGQNCHTITRYTPLAAYLAAQEGMSERYLERTGPNSTSVIRDPHNPFFPHHGRRPISNVNSEQRWVTTTERASSDRKP